MSKRLMCLTLLVVITAGSTGCNCIYCLHDNLLSSYKGRRWADCGCGEVYYGPWVDTPPECCDECDNYGNFHARRYWTSASSWFSNQRQSCNPWQAGNRRPVEAGMPTDAPVEGGPVYDDSMDGMNMQGESIGPGNQMPTPAGPQMNPQMNPRMNQPTPAAPPSSPSPRMGYRQRGMAMQPPNPYNNNFNNSASYNY